MMVEESKSGGLKYVFKQSNKPGDLPGGVIHTMIGSAWATTC